MDAGSTELPRDEPAGVREAGQGTKSPKVWQRQCSARYGNLEALFPRIARQFAARSNVSVGKASL
jgi:hypothetical protein